jgi:hypothetical protein
MTVPETASRLTAHTRRELLIGLSLICRLFDDMADVDLRAVTVPTADRAAWTAFTARATRRRSHEGAGSGWVRIR